MVEAHPHEGDQAPRVSDEPGVPPLVGRAGLAGHRALDAEKPRRGARAPLHDALQERGDEEGFLGPHGRCPAPSRGLRHAAATIEHRPDRRGRDPISPVGEGDVRGRQLERRHLEAAEGDRRDGREPAGEAGPAGGLDDLVVADRLRHPDGGRVERLLERPPHRHRALETVLVVAGRPRRLTDLYGARPVLEV